MKRRGWLIALCVMALMVGAFYGAATLNARQAAQEQRAKVIEAEAEVPRAMAAALREGKLGVMDYYNMQNVISDTRMRESIAGTDATVAKPLDEQNGNSANKK